MKLPLRPQPQVSKADNYLLSAVLEPLAPRNANAKLVKTYSSSDIAVIDFRLLADSASSKVLPKPVTPSSGYESTSPILEADLYSLDEVIERSLKLLGDAQMSLT